MATCKRFTDHTGSEVDVNIDQVAYIQRHGDLTNLCFAGGVGNGSMMVISVKETPDRVHMMETLRSLS